MNFMTEPPPPSSSSSSSQLMPDDSLYPSNMAILTRRGYKGGLPSQQVNQDRAFYASMSEDGISSATNRNDNREQEFIMGIFDGHGELGHEVSHQVVQMLPGQLMQQLQQLAQEEMDSYASNPWRSLWNSKADGLHNEKNGSGGEDEEDRRIQKALENAVRIVDDSLSRDIASQAGCTASIVLRKGSKLYVANVGDSTTFVALVYEESIQTVDTNVTTLE